jgi:riboflavin biosynthesis pyrimidine reductase
VITVDPRKGNGAEISGFNEPDRFVMGLLRTLADVIIVGAGTVRAAGAHEWTPRRVHRGYADAYAAWRRELGLAPQPTTVVVTATGEGPADHPAVSTADVPVVVVTTRQAADAVTRRLPTRIRIHASDRGDRVTANAIEAVLRDVRARVALCEGGPHLAGTLLDGGLVDELFLTLAPQVLGRGRDAERRLSLVAGTEFGLDEAPWARLMSVHRSVDHLFLRYGFKGDA